MAVSPGDALTLATDDVRVTVDPAHGGRLASLSIEGHDLLVERGDAPDRSIAWGCFLMAPWPGRLADARLQWHGTSQQLPKTHGRHGIHGLLHDVPWQVELASPQAAELSVDLGAHGWPFEGVARQSIRLVEPATLEVHATLEAREAMPAALGWHPWFWRRGEVRVTVGAAETLETRGMIPTGRRVPVGRRTDLRDGPALGRRRLDDAYVNASSPASIAWPDLELDLGFEAPATVVVYTQPDRFCVEPQTAWPNALGLEDAAARSAGRQDLEPGGRLEAAMTWTWRPRDHG